MKRTFLFALAAIISLKTFASYYVTLTHALCVDRIECWAPQYLTVTCNYNNKLFTSAPSTLKVLSVITEINGRSTEFMDIDEFYNILDSNSDIRLTYITKTNGENKEFSEKLRKFVGNPVIESKKHDYFQPDEPYYNLIAVARGKQNFGDYYNLFYHNWDEYYSTHTDDNTLPWYKQKTVYDYTDFAEASRPDKNVIITDLETDFSLFNTFDYAYNDAIEEFEQKQLLREFASALESRGMKKVDKNPDVYLYVTLQSDRSIESVYMPKQVTNYNANAYRKITYGYYSNYGYGSAHSQTVTEEQGKMRSFTTNDAYLQITMLDAKCLNKAQPPKVWQYTYMDRIDKNMTSKIFREKIRDYTIIYPFYPEYAYQWKYCGWDIKYLGFYLDNDNTTISGSIPNSFAEQNKINVGDQVTISQGLPRHGSKKYKTSVFLNKNGHELWIKKIGNKKMKSTMVYKPDKRITILNRKDFLIKKQQ